MNRRILTFVVLALIANVGLAIVAAQPGVREPSQLVKSLETTLEERLQTVDAVMRIRIDTAGVARAIDITDVLERNNPGLTMAHRAFVPVTEYQTRAVEVIKGFAYGVVGAPLRIGFLTERAIGPQGREVILTDVGHPPSLTRGATYLVLLTYSEETNMLMSIAGDVYRVDGRVVRGNSPAAATEYGKAIVGKPVEEALTLVRAAVERAR